MLDAAALDLLSCPACGHGSLEHQVFDQDREGGIRDAVVWCRSCRGWYPVEDGLLDLLVGDLAYGEDRAAFRRRHEAALQRLDVASEPAPPSGDAKLQAVQQAHFDWYAANDRQSYLDYARMPFWVAVDAQTFAEWRPKIRPGSTLLDAGCGNGRGTFQIMDLDLRILAFDVAKASVREAQKRYRERPWAARTVFFAADATRFPVKTATMDHVLVYGVLHHMPDPAVTCREIGRVMKDGGVYFGSENNTTVFRSLFELLQRLRPIWFEEAGPEALISARSLEEAFDGTGVEIHTRSFVFVPPHLVNLLPGRGGQALLRWSDRVGQALPWLRENGGLILIEGTRG